MITSCICVHPLDPDVIIETCSYCSKIRSYNTNTGENADIHTGTDIRAICTGPVGSILGADREGRILQFRWKHNSKLELIHSVETNITDVEHMCYVDDNDTVVLSCWFPDPICAVKLNDGSTLWQFNQQINGKDIDPLGL